MEQQAKNQKVRKTLKSFWQYTIQYRNLHFIINDMVDFSFNLADLMWWAANSFNGYPHKSWESKKLLWKLHLQTALLFLCCQAMHYLSAWQEVLRISKILWVIYFYHHSYMMVYHFCEICWATVQFLMCHTKTLALHIIKCNLFSLRQNSLLLSIIGMEIMSDSYCIIVKTIIVN